MALSCRLENTARPVVNLDSPKLAAVRRLGAARNVQLVTELLRQRVPGLTVQEDYFDDARPAWWEGGTVFINLSRADVSSPLHELSELWGAVYEQQQPQAYEQTLQMLRGSEAYEQTRRAYPDLDERGQLREALHLEVQQQAGSLLESQTATGAAGRLWAFVQKLFYRLGARLSPQRLAKLQQGKLTTSELTQALARELVLGTGGVLSELSSQDIERLGSYARDQRLTNENLNNTITHEALGVTNSGELLEFLSGQEVNAGGVSFSIEAQNIVRNWGHKPEFRYQIMVLDESGSLRKEVGSQSWQGSDEFARIAQVKKFLQKNQALPDGEAIGLAADLFWRLREPLRNSEVADGNRPAGMSAAEADLAYGPHGIFPEFVPGEKVVRYSAESMGQDYDPALDTGNLLVHLDSAGKPKCVAAITRQRLGEKEHTSKLLGGLRYYRKKTGNEKATLGKLAKASAGKTERVDLSASPEQLQKLQAQLLAMHLTRRGHRMSTVSVANITSLEAGKENQNAVTRVLPTSELQALKNIRQQAAVRQLLTESGAGGQRLLEILDDDSLYRPEQYTTDYLGSLLTNFKGADAYSQGKIQQYASEYERQKSDASLDRLLQAVVDRKRALLATVRNLEEEQQTEALAANAEFVQLAHAEAQLRQVSEFLNPHRGLDTVDKMSLDYLNNDNPAMVYLVNRYKVLKTRITDAFTPRARQRKKLIEALRAEKGGVVGKLLDKEQDVYRNLVQTRKAWRYNEENKLNGVAQLEEVELPSWHFKLPGTAEFNQLTPAEQNFITFELGQIRDQFVRWHRESHRDLNTGEPGSEQAALEYYQKEWGQGQIPLTPASVSTRRMQGDWLGSLEDSVNELLSQNPHFDDPGGQSLHLREYYQGQGGSSTPWGGESRQRLLGISRTSEVHPETGQPLGFLVDESWEKIQARFDQDLGRGQAVWSVELLRHEFQQDAERDYKTATVLLKDEEQASAFLRTFVPGSSQAGGDERVPGRYAWMKSEQAANLEKAFRQLFLGDTQQGGGSAQARKLARLAAVSASVFRAAIYKGNVLRPIRQTISGLVGQLGPILASQSTESRKVLDPKHLKAAAAVVGDARNWDFLLQLGVHLDVISPSSRALAHSLLFSGKQRTASDVFDVDALMDKLGDEVLSLTTMVLHLQTSGAWGAYSWNAETKEFEYSEAADRKSRGDAVVDSVKTNLVANGLLEPGETLNRAYDLFLLRSLESSVSDVKGGYSPASSTELGASVLGNQLLGQRRWFVRRVLNAVGRKRVSAARGYKDADGKWVGLTEEGQWQSLQTGFWQLHAVGFNPLKAGQAWGQLGAHEQENLRRLSANLAVSGAAMLAVAALAGLWDDEEDEENKRRSRQMGVLDAIVQEAFVLENMSFALDAAANPFLMVNWLKQMGTGVGNYLTGDFAGGNRVMKSKFGLGKVYSFGESVLGEEE